MKLDTKEITILVVKAEGLEVKAHKMLEFLDGLKGCSVAAPFRWDGRYKDAARICIEKGIVVENARGSWVLNDEDARAELLDELREQVANFWDEQGEGEG